MSGLGFLKSIKLTPNSVANPTARTSSAVAKNPTNADIRVYKNGAVYPSAKLVAACDLQYRPKSEDKTADKGNGFDVFSSKQFLNTKDIAEAFVIIAMVPRNDKKGKLSLFASTTYETEGANIGDPKSDVLTQGAVTAGLEILEMLKDTYGYTIPEGENFVDLKIVGDSPMTTDDAIYYIPKVISRGDDKGQVDMVRRENLTLYPLAPISLLGETVAEPQQGIVTDEVTEVPSPSLADIEAGETDENTVPAAAAELPDDVKTELNLEGADFILEGTSEDEDEDETLNV